MSLAAEVGPFVSLFIFFKCQIVNEVFGSLTFLFGLDSAVKK